LVTTQGKFIIGLTGNIATGKTVVRRMLEHLGASTIDADGLAHRAIARGAPGYGPVVETFGRWILDGNGDVDRAKLGGLVFRDATALARLEEIVHPLVRQAIDILLQRAQKPVVVIEAIKLLEGPLKDVCDSIWVTYAPRVLQIERLTAKREMSHEEALQRIGMQGPQTDKIAAANVVIRNTGSYDDLWRRVVDAWKEHVPSAEAAEVAVPETSTSDKFTVRRGRPRDAETIAGLINRLSGKEPALSADDVMAGFGEKAYMLLCLNRVLVGVAGWQVENLVVRITDLYLEPGLNTEQALGHLVREIETISRVLECEASLIFPNRDLAADTALWSGLGYEGRPLDALGVQAWIDAAKESMPLHSDLFFKQLRKERVLRPI
jgi:dephospho-CoA kinase